METTPALIKMLEDLINKDASPLNSLQNYNYSQSDMTVQTAVAEMTLQHQTNEPVELDDFDMDIETGMEMAEM